MKTILPCLVRILVGCTAFLILTTGCGTIASLEYDWQYGGYDVERSSAAPRAGIYSGVRTDAHHAAEPGDSFIPSWFFLADIPFSACADTVCLPYTVFRQASQSRYRFRVVDLVFSANNVRWITVTGSTFLSPARANAALRDIRGRPKSVWVNLTGEDPVSTAEYGVFCETILSNATLRIAQQSRSLTNAADLWLAANPSRKTAYRHACERVDRTPDILAGVACGSICLASVIYISWDARRRRAHWTTALLGLLFGAVGLLLWFLFRPHRTD